MDGPSESAVLPRAKTAQVVLECPGAGEEYLVLSVLWVYDGITVPHLCTRLQVSETVLVSWLEHLEAEALVERAPDVPPPDAWLTEKGRALQHQVAHDGNSITLTQE